MGRSSRLYKADNHKNKEASEKKSGNKLLKFFMLAIVLFSITILSSCFVAPPGMGTRKSMQHNQDNRNNHEGRHDNGQHRGHHK